MNVSLRDWQEGDEEAAVRWSQDYEFCQANGWTQNLPADEVRGWWRERGEAAQSQYLKMIVLGGHVVGYAEWQDLQGDVAELGIAVGDSGQWGQGIGQQAGRLMLEWAFGPLNLQKVWAEVHQPNARSLALMHRLGFRETGREGEDDYQGQKVPMVQFEMTQQEFEKS